MKFKRLFPKFNVPVSFEHIEDASQYWFKSDRIILNSSLKTALPGCAKVTLTHETMHSTGSKNRLNRIERLEKHFGPYTSRTAPSYRVEECICEVATMVAMMKLGMFNQYSSVMVTNGLEEHYGPDIYIPVREVRAAVKYFADDCINFENEIQETIQYLEAFMDITFRDTYEEQTATA